MTVQELMDELQVIVNVHPETKEASVWAKGDGYSYPIKFVAFDKKHKPPRIRLDEA